MNKHDNDYYYYVVRSNIKKYRQKAKLTTQELADKSDFTHQFIRDLESLKLNRRPRIDTVARIYGLDGFPKNSSWLTRDLKKFLSVLESQNIVFSIKSTNKGSNIKLSKI